MNIGVRMFCLNDIPGYEKLTSMFEISNRVLGFCEYSKLLGLLRICSIIQRCPVSSTELLGILTISTDPTYLNLYLSCNEIFRNSRDAYLVEK